jgi:hypothetical protein
MGTDMGTEICPYCDWREPEGRRMGKNARRGIAVAEDERRGSAKYASFLSADILSPFAQPIFMIECDISDNAAVWIDEINCIESPPETNFK